MSDRFTECKEGRRVVIEGDVEQFLGIGKHRRSGNIYTPEWDSIYTTAEDSVGGATFPWESTTPQIVTLHGPLDAHRPDIEIGPSPILVFDSALVRAASASAPPAVVGRADPHELAARWLETVSVFIPKSIREPFLGDLCEDLERMRARGSSRLAIWGAVVAQVMLLLLQRLIPRWLQR